MPLLRNLLQFSGDSVDVDDDQFVEWSEPMVTPAVKTSETEVVMPFTNVTEAIIEVLDGTDTMSTTIITSAESQDQIAQEIASMDGWTSDRITIEVTTIDQTVKPLTRPTTTMEIQIKPTNTSTQLSISSITALTVEAENAIDITFLAIGPRDFGQFERSER